MTNAQINQFKKKKGGKLLYIVSLPFEGYCQNVAHECNDGEFRAYYTKSEVLYKGHTVNMTLQEYMEKNGENLTVVTEAQFNEMLAQHYADLVTEPQEVEEDYFIDMLEVLPPSRWNNIDGVEFFHVSERLTGNLVTWLAKYDGKHYCFTDYDNKSNEEIINKVWRVNNA